MRTLAWKKKPLRIVDFIPPGPEVYERLDLQEQFLIRKSLGFNCEHVEVHDIAEGESGITFYPSDCAVEVRKNILEQIESQYDKLEINPIVYFNVHWLSSSLAVQHPDYQQVFPDGEPIPSAYGSGAYSCINSPFREYAFQVIRNLSAYKIKGIFLDGPFFRIEGCYCRSCKHDFQKAFHYELPVWEKATPQERKDLFRFKRESIALFMKQASRLLKSKKPDAMIYMNSPQLVPTIYCSRDNRLTVEHQDMLLAEGGFLSDDLRQVPIWKPAATAQLLETQSAGKPYCVAIAGRLAPWSRYLLSAAETWLTHAMAVSHGANTWYGVYNDNNLDPRMQTVREINTFLEENEGCYTDTKSMASVALMWSYDTANFYQSSAEETDFTAGQDKMRDPDKSDARGSFMGWYDVLSRSRIPFDIVDNASITDGSLAKYELLILPNVSVMNEEEANRIKAYVNRGGKVIGSFDTSLYQEDGQKRNQPLLAEVFGITLRAIRHCQYDHIECDSRHDLLTSIDQQLIPAARLGTEVASNHGAESVMFYREKQISRYCELPRKTSHPYVVKNGYGLGESIYFAGNVGKFYEAYALPEYRKLMENAVKSLVEIPIHVGSVQNTESIHVSLRNQGENRILIHVINYTASMTRPITEVLPLPDLTINIRLPKEVDSITFLRSKKSADFVQHGGWARIQLPTIKEYEVVDICLLST
ncbi:beta-galactosidase trimerization domain-containing protein [Fictibacillus sp. WQ 8-8]|uniref:beta-galactosidase trimerization domain-containing protein n=1 Tax=Fictibacillus sp. WQ 8-8 TaxID=2938788 RepID=UPI00210AA094|nr:beta-galactosidase trimerization domain-containing protein [Fictibacillus sp. WQ 8-8]MCQ6267945.1 beta-galactosidase trimerization domain-containing protein [Fictibacillus sp. WQ 8-8]